VGELEQWLIDFLSTSDLAAHYKGKDRELLKEDLRTATFLVREARTSSGSRILVAGVFPRGYLRRALVEGRPGAWALPRVSPET